MALLIPLVLMTLLPRLVAQLLLRGGRQGVAPWANWPGAVGVGLASVFLFGSLSHFIEPARSGLIAIVPAWVPFAPQVVTLSGLAELALAIGLVLPRGRRLAAALAFAFLLAVFPANVVAAQGIDHPAPPNTALLPRAAAQAVYLGAAVIAAWPGRNRLDPTAPARR